MKGYLFLLVVLVLLVIGAGGAFFWLLKGVGPDVFIPERNEIPPTPTVTQLDAAESEEGIAGGKVDIEDVNVVVLDSEQTEIYGVVRGRYTDGCSVLGGQFVRRDDRTFVVVLSTRKDEEGTCEKEGGTFEETVTLNVGQIAEGEYEVDVNGTKEKFTIGDEVVVKPSLAPTKAASGSGQMEEKEASGEGEL